MNVKELQAVLTDNNVEFLATDTKVILETKLKEFNDAKPKNKAKRKLVKRAKGTKQNLIKRIVKRTRYDEDTETSEHLITTDSGVQYKLFKLATIDESTDTTVEEVLFTSFLDDCPSSKKVDKGLYMVSFEEKLIIEEGDDLPEEWKTDEPSTKNFIWGVNPIWIRK